MQIDLDTSCQNRIDDIIEQLSTRYNMEDLSASELVGALLDLAMDLLFDEEYSMNPAKSRFLEHCGERLGIKAV